MLQKRFWKAAFRGRSRGGAHLHWLYRLRDGQLLEMPFLPGGTGADVTPLPAAGPCGALTALALERSPGVLGQTTFPATGLLGVATTLSATLRNYSPPLFDFTSTPFMILCIFYI